MLKKTVIAAGLGTAVVLGGTGLALAAAAPSTTPSTAPSSTTTPSTGSTTHKHAHHKGEAFRGEYAQWTTYNSTTKTDVVHDGIRGDVTAVSATSISVKAKDGTTKSFAVTSTTKVHVKGQTKSSTATVSQVKVGDRVEVTGTGTGSLTATHVRDRGVPTTK